LEGFSEKDGLILSLLQENARLSYSDIGEKVGLSRVAVKNRITALEKQGIIKGYHAEIDAAALPAAIPFYAYVETKPEAYEEISGLICSLPEAKSVFHATGSCSIIALCLAPSKEAQRQLMWILRNRKDVVRVSVTDILEIPKGRIAP